MKFDFDTLELGGEVCPPMTSSIALQAPTITTSIDTLFDMSNVPNDTIAEEGLFDNTDVYAERAEKAIDGIKFLLGYVDGFVLGKDLVESIEKMDYKKLKGNNTNHKFDGVSLIEALRTNFDKSITDGSVTQHFFNTTSIQKTESKTDDGGVQFLEFLTTIDKNFFELGQKFLNDDKKQGISYVVNILVNQFGDGADGYFKFIEKFKKPLNKIRHEDVVQLYPFFVWLMKLMNEELAKLVRVLQVFSSKNTDSSLYKDNKDIVQKQYKQYPNWTKLQSEHYPKNDWMYDGSRKK